MRSPFQLVLDWDKDASYFIYRSYNAHLPAFPLHLLEIAAHGVPWLVVPLVALLFYPSLSPTNSALLVNLLAVTIIDLGLIALFKPIFRRSRPHYNRSIAPLSLHAVDQFSFPSGHATRAGLVAAFVPLAAVHHQLPVRWAFWGVVVPCVILWALATGVSRIALGRHHIIDVVVGLLLGVMYVAFWAPFWVPPAVGQSLRDQLRGMLFGAKELHPKLVERAVRSTMSVTSMRLARRLCRLHSLVSNSGLLACAGHISQ